MLAASLLRQARFLPACLRVGSVLAIPSFRTAVVFIAAVAATISVLVLCIGHMRTGRQLLIKVLGLCGAHYVWGSRWRLAEE